MILPSGFFELAMNNLPYGVYVLDTKGNYIFANVKYLDMIGMDKQTLLHENVHNFLSRGEITFSVSDIVFREKRRVIAYQDVSLATGLQTEPFRHLIVSNPVFDEAGEIKYIVASCVPVAELHGMEQIASENIVSFARTLTQSKKASDHTVPIVAASTAMCNLLASSRAIANIDASVLIQGETGTGKEVIAQYIHQHGNRADHHLVVINCASLPENLLEAELFGYEKGAFTGASQKGKPGLIEKADGGTLFLDEINSLPLPLQGKLLRALETKEIQHIGSTTGKKVDFRLLAATNEDLKQMVEKGLFRADLYYRLNVIPLFIPALRSRKEDILPLAEVFLKEFNSKYDQEKLFSENTIQLISMYDWPGNVRELKNFVERAVIMTSGDTIGFTDINNIISSIQIEPEAYHPVAVFSDYLPEQHAAEMLKKGISLSDYTDQCEKAYLKFALSQCVSTYQAAAVLQTSQSAVMRKKKKYQL